MKGLVLLFITIIFSGIGWRYCPPKTKREVTRTIKANLVVFILASIAVSIAVFFSVNTTLRLV